MKKLTKLIAVICAMALLSGCGLVGESEKAKQKKEADNAVVTVNGTTISKERFNFYFYNEEDEMLKTAGISNAADIPDNFWEQKAEGKTILETVKESALKKAVDDVLLYQKAVDEKIELTSDEKSMITSQIAQMKQDSNTMYQLEQVGIGVDEYQKLFEESLYIQKLTEKYIEDGKIKVDENQALEEMKGKYVKAKHVLIMTQGQDGNPVSDEEKEKKLAIAKEVLQKAKSGEDFDKLVSTYGEDPGMQSTPEGYLFTTGEMVPEFESAAFALGEEQISDIVETSYGYHIIKRVPFDLKADRETQIISSFKSSQAVPEMENIAKKMKADSKIEKNKKVYDAIKATLVKNN